jgi:anaerobic magnesium-protoporphyrin IX monomethyl ester cyclase
VEFLFINVNQRDSPQTIPLPMAYILAYLRRMGHGGVILDDLLGRRLSLYALEMWITKLKPAVIGFSAYQESMETIRFFSRYVKLNHKDIRVLLGGPQAIFLPSAALKELQDVDIICRGEGEKITAAIAECLENNKPLSSISGVSFREGDRVIDVPPALDQIEDLDQFPSPYLDNIINLEGKDTAMIYTSRGCTYNCLFCISPSFRHRKIRYHSTKRVLDEMEYLERKGIKELWIADSNFPTSYGRDWEILQGKIDRGIKIPFYCETRFDLVDDQMLKKLREAGAIKISF